MKMQIEPPLLKPEHLVRAFGSFYRKWWRMNRRATEIRETKMPLALNRLILYARDVGGTVAF
jgi:hypothetical protein